MPRNVRAFGKIGKMPTALLLDGRERGFAQTRKALTAAAGIHVLAESTTVADALPLLQSLLPDIVLADGKTLGPDGTEVLLAAAPNVQIMIVADDASLAEVAFRQGASDYLLRPLTADGLTVALRRLLVQAGQPADGLLDQTRLPERNRVAKEPAAVGGGESSLTIDDKVAVSLQRGRSMDLVPVSDIVWVEALQNYSRLQLTNHRPVVLKRTLAEWESLLPAGHFERISRSLIIQLSRLRSSQWQSRDETLLTFDGVDARITVGRSAATRLKELLREGRRR